MINVVVSGVEESKQGARYADLHSLLPPTQRESLAMPGTNIADQCKMSSCKELSKKPERTVLMRFYCQCGLVWCEISPLALSSPCAYDTFFEFFWTQATLLIIIRFYSNFRSREVCCISFLWGKNRTILKVVRTVKKLKFIF